MEDVAHVRRVTRMLQGCYGLSVHLDVWSDCYTGIVTVVLVVMFRYLGHSKKTYIYLLHIGDIRLDESGFGFGECIRDVHVYTCTL